MNSSHCCRCHLKWSTSFVDFVPLGMDCSRDCLGSTLVSNLISSYDRDPFPHHLYSKFDVSSLPFCHLPPGKKNTCIDTDTNNLSSIATYLFFHRTFLATPRWHRCAVAAIAELQQFVCGFISMPFVRSFV